MPTIVTFIIVNYNGQAFLEKCLTSVFSQSRLPNEVIVVDNASGDNSVTLIRELFPKVRVISLPKNVGYSAGCNHAIEEVSGDLVAILNNDIILDQRWLESLLAYDCKPWDFWASRILFAVDPSRVDSAGDGMAIVGAAYKIGHGDLAVRHERSQEVFGPCGAAALYRRSLLNQVGGFDPDFFLVYEDADLNMRARLLGYRYLYVPEATLLHQVNASIRTFSYPYVFWGHRNSEYVFWKNMPTSLLLLYLPERVLFNLLSFLFFLFKGRAWTFCQAKIDFARNFSTIIQKRRKIQRTRKLSPGQVRKLLDRNWFKYRFNFSITP